MRYIDIRQDIINNTLPAIVLPCLDEVRCKNNKLWVVGNGCGVGFGEDGRVGAGKGGRGRRDMRVFF